MQLIHNLIHIAVLVWLVGRLLQDSTQASIREIFTVKLFVQTVVRIVVLLHCTIYSNNNNKHVYLYSV